MTPRPRVTIAICAVALLVALPLFTFAGSILAESGAPRRLVAVSRELLGWMPGGLALVALLACALFTAFTGASGVQYGLRLLECLIEAKRDVYLMVSQAAQVVINMETDLRRALARGEFAVYYQPIVTLSDRRIVAFEALLRWNNGNLGFVPPDAFIPVAERTDLILDIGPETAAAFAAIVRDAGTVIWNGPVGVFEFDRFADGTKVLAEAIAGIMGLSIEAKEPDIARPGCTYGVADADTKFLYDGLNDCRAAALLSGGMKVCTIGCLGLGTCQKACPLSKLFCIFV